MVGPGVGVSPTLTDCEAAEKLRLVTDKSRTDSDYQVPSDALFRAIGSPELPSFRPNPDDSRLLVVWSSRYLSLDDLGQPEKRLAGLRFHPGLRCSIRQSFVNRLELQVLCEGRYQTGVKIVGLPRRLQALDPLWSPDGERLALIVVQKKRCSLWVIEASSGQARQVSRRQPQGVNGFDVEWLDSQNLLCLMVGRPGAAQTNHNVRVAPSIQEHQKVKQTARTYQDLLKSEQDALELEHYLSSVPVRISLADDCETELAAPGLYLYMNAAPGKKHLLLDSVIRPFSYSVPLTYFPRRTEVVDLAEANESSTGQLSRLVVRELPLQENVPTQFDSVRPGRRLVQWQTCSDQTLCWVEALDEGDSTRPTEFRDRLFLARVPDRFSHSSDVWPAPDEIVASSGDLQGRLSRVLWGADGLAVLEEHWWKNRRSRRHWCKFDLSAETSGTKALGPWNLISDLCWEDTYNDPGRPLVRQMPDGRKLLVEDAKRNCIYLTGDGASPEGNRPFLDELCLAEDPPTASRLFRSEAPYFEYPWRFDPQTLCVMLTRERRDLPPNLFALSLANDGPAIEQRTFLRNHFPDLQEIEKQLISYRRSDGVELSGTLYLPSGQKERLPLLLWVYPGEIKNAALAGQVEDSPYRFLRPFWGGAMLFALAGYAVLEYPTFPIVGEGDAEPNDTYIEQLVSSAQAAVDYLDSHGFVDPKRCAVGGHSYGAFTVANLLAHSRIFACGIARSGAYNRTLTPFGFQSEERNFWDAKDVYHRLSPFENSDKLEGPLLLIHGADDNNSGTHCMQSERFYQALKGLGKPARLVMLPHESHSYQARESILHVLHEMEQWLERHLGG